METKTRINKSTVRQIMISPRKQAQIKTKQNLAKKINNKTRNKEIGISCTQKECYKSIIRPSKKMIRQFELRLSNK